MKVLVLTRVATDGGRSAAMWMGQELRRAGVLVNHCPLDHVASELAVPVPDHGKLSPHPVVSMPETAASLSGSTAPHRTGSASVRAQSHQVANRFTGVDLIVYIADELTMADAGGPWLRQMSSWAERALTPLIAVAPTCDVSTREWRSLGVEAGYAVSTPQDARRVVVTWAPTEAPSS